MIDTVILRIPKHLLQINEATWQSFHQNGHSMKWMRNMTKQEKDNAIYRPRITGQKRTGQQAFVKIEFSCPKMVYGNNLNELQESGFEVLLESLRNSLVEIGINASTSILRRADVLAFHPSKNIQLTNGYTANFVIKELQKVNIKRTFDLNKSDFRNDGQSLQVYTNSHSLVFYDKIADLRKPLKRAIDRDQTAQQLNLFKEIQETKPRLEILRMEVRLTNRRKISSLMKKIDLPIKPSFEELFQNNLCKKVLWDYWGQIFANQNSYLLDAYANPHKLLQNLIRGSPNGVSAKHAIFLVGLKTLAQNEAGMNTLRNSIEKSYSPRTWGRILKQTKELNNASGTPKQEWVKQIENQLQNYKPLSI